jgi:methylated-DNA-[protein]-cysteine S-methyltransferase
VWGESARGALVYRVFLSTEERSAADRVAGAFPGLQRSGHVAVAELVDGFRRFLRGEPRSFALDMVALRQCPEFQQGVLVAEHRIPRGWVSTYGRIARHVGVARGARAAGSALARNPFPIIVPCHRAIRSDGTLGGFQGGTKMKRALLELEGVAFSRTGRVLTENLYY